MPTPSLADLPVLVAPLLHTDLAGLELAGAVRAPTVGAPRIRALDSALPAGSWPATGAPDDNVHPVSAALWRLPADTLVTDLSDTMGAEWTDRENEPGSGAVTFFNDDADLALLADGDLIRFKLYDETAFAIVVSQRETDELMVDGEAHEVTVVSGDGAGSLAAEIVVYAANGVGSQPIERTRLFGWQAPAFDDGSWGPAYVKALQGDAVASWTDGGAYPSGYPRGYPDPAAAWIGGVLGDWFHAPGGTTLYRYQFTLSAAGKYVLVWGGDNDAWLWIDGIEIGRVEDWRELRRAVLDLSAGEHTVAVEVHNHESPVIDGTGNPTGFLADLYEFAANGDTDLGAVVWRTQASGWKVLQFPSTIPGVTPGEAVLQVLAEHVARGGSAILTPTFTAAVDSAGQPWPILAQLATKTGATLLAFLGELTTYVDWWVSPGSLELSMWVKGTRGQPRPVALVASTGDPDTGNLVELGRTVT